MSRPTILAGLTTMLVAATTTALLAQAPAGAAGTVKGFVRVNGTPLAVRHAYAVTGPDSFDPSEEVTLVLLTPAPIAADALAKASTRNDVFGLVSGGAIVEVRKNGHNVFLRHVALKGQQLQTGGGFPEFKTPNNRISGDVHTFMSGDQDEFGFKVRFELAFDAPIVKRLPIAKTTAAPAAPATPPARRAPTGPLPKSRGEAGKWLESNGFPTAPTATDALGTYLTLSNTLTADAVRAYLLFGADVKKPALFTDTYPLNSLVIMCHGKPEAAAIAELLLQAGADPNQKELDSRKASPAMGAVTCPDVLKAILARKPDLNAVDANGLTAMHYALRFGQPRDVTARMIKDAGFDMVRWRKSLVDDFDAATVDAIGKPAASRATPSPSPSPAPATATPAPAPRAAAIDWKALGPYPSRSRTEATRALARPGTDTTVDDHFWDAITRREPQRLAVALQAGANVKQIRPVTGYTPLVLFAERCEVNRDVEVQENILGQLIAAGVDLTGVDANKANALTLAAHSCPIGAVHALIREGMPLQAVTIHKSTALQAAILAERVDVVEALLDAGLDLKKEPYNVGRFASGSKPIQAALKKKRK